MTGLMNPELAVDEELTPGPHQVVTSDRDLLSSDLYSSALPSSAMTSASSPKPSPNTMQVITKQASPLQPSPMRASLCSCDFANSKLKDSPRFSSRSAAANDHSPLLTPSPATPSPATPSPATPSATTTHRFGPNVIENDGALELAALGECAFSFLEVGAARPFIEQQHLANCPAAAVANCPHRRYECEHYTTCLSLAAALNWDSFTCNGCDGTVNEQLLWQGHLASRKDSVAQRICFIPKIHALECCANSEEKVPQSDTSAEDAALKITKEAPRG